MHIYTHTCFRMEWGLTSKASLREEWSKSQGERERRKERGKEERRLLTMTVNCTQNL